MNKVLEILNSDWLGIAAQKWKEIPSLYKKSFLIIFIGVNIAFAFNTFSFIVGDHDWPKLINPVKIHGAISWGRFAGFYLQYFLTGNHILPVLLNLYIFLILSISSVLLCIYWRVPKTLFAFSAIGLLLAIQPYFSLWLYYSFQIISSIALSIMIGYMLSELAVFAESKTKKAIFIAVPIILFIFALGAYPPIINTMAVVFLGRLIIDIFLDWDVSFEGIKNILNKHKWTIITVVIGIILFQGILLLLEYLGFMHSSYHTGKTAFIDLPARFIKVADAAFTTLWRYRVAFFPDALIRLFAVVFYASFFIAAFNILKDKRLNGIKRITVKIITIFFLMTLIVILAKTAAIISDEYAPLIEPRILFFGDAFLHIFPIALLFIQKFRLPKNLMIIVCLVLINMCLIQDALISKVWKFGFEAEKMAWNRIAATIETNSKFSKNKKYELIIIGKFPSYRPYYYGGNKKSGGDILNDGYASIHPISAFSFFFPELKIGSKFNVVNQFQQYLKRRNGDKRYESALKAFEYMKKEISNAQVWPSPNSILIKDNVIIIVFSQEDLNAIQEFLKNNNL